MSKVEMKKGFLLTSARTTFFIGDEETWDSLIAANTVSDKERDINGKPYNTLSHEELNMLADYGLVNCQNIQGRDIVDYYFEIGSHRVAFGSRTWYYFTRMRQDEKVLTTEYFSDGIPEPTSFERRSLRAPESDPYLASPPRPLVVPGISTIPHPWPFLVRSFHTDRPS